jgi:glycerol-1-phosphate dehydrogenase [NAD(P)+]
MSAGILAAVLDGTYRDALTGAAVKVGVAKVHIADSLAGIEGDLVTSLDLGKRIVLVSDPRTHEVLGHRVAAALEKLGRLDQTLYIETPHADDATVAKIRAATKSADAFIAVGSGTINDLCKYAGALERKPYAVFGTAPSMNGFTSANAAITVQGHKKSLPAQEPLGVFLDLQVLANAPKRLIRSGLGDSVCRATAQADWLLSHLIRGTPYLQTPFDLLVEDEAGLFADPTALVRGDLTAMGCLARTLVLSGFGMTIAGGSHPASQGEHLISHYAEMMGAADLPVSFHGEQIAVATPFMAALQSSLLDGPPPVLSAGAWTQENINAHFGPELGVDCWRDYKRKALSAEAADQINARLADDWDDIVNRITEIARTPDEIMATLKAAGAPSQPGDIGWSDGFFDTAARHARLIRDRYTFLDLAGDKAA